MMRRADRDEDVAHETPPAVVGAVSIGTAPLPFLAVYAVLFIVHGTFAPDHPPAITSSQSGELVAGIVALVLFVALAFSLWFFLNGRRRWPFAIGQLAVLGTTVWFLTDQTKGGAVVSALLVATSLISLACGFAPDGWRHVGQAVPARLAGMSGRRSASDTSAAPVPSTDPTLVEPAALRRRHAGSD